MACPATIARIRERVGDAPVYLSLDIDVLDPAYAPGTGTPEVGGYTTIQMQDLLRGLGGLDFVGFDLVEVLPQYDGPGQITVAAGRQPLLGVPGPGRPPRAGQIAPVSCAR